MQHRKILLATGLFLSLNAVNAQAALFDRGGGLVYDNVLDLTWLKDANYAKTLGYDNGGQLEWNNAQSWAANLTYHDSIRNVDYSDWRLPTVNTSCNNGPLASCLGENVDTNTSELAYMFHINLGNQSQNDTSGNPRPGYTFIASPSFQDAANGNAINSFINLESYGYWTGSEWPTNPDTAWFFNTAFGNQLTEFKIDEFYAWAVRPGDVAAVPLPNALWLFASSLLMLISRKKFRY